MVKEGVNVYYSDVGCKVDFFEGEKDEDDVLEDAKENLSAERVFVCEKCEEEFDDLNDAIRHERDCKESG